MSSQKGWFTPAKNVLLTGAGFTKDFGGHLASEMWSVILNQPEIRRYPSLREILLGELNFEQVYDQVPARSSPEEQAAFHSALNNAYGQMHRGICQPENDPRSSAVCSNFLAQFQKRRGNQQEKAFFFTLNQDLFVERFYLNNFNHEGLIKIPGLQHQKWFNWQLSDELQQEDLRQLPDEDQMEAIKREFWSKSTENFAYVKLHGSYGWIDKDGTQKMVMGNTKTGVIQREPLLRWYLSLFAKVLSQQDQNLVVVGYGFRDDHINKVIADAIKERGLRLFVVSPKQPRDFRQMLFSEGCVCYVIYAPESWESPHFLTKRRWAWIRTDEFSQRFETRLATFEEIQHLANRRALAVERHERLYTRAVGRFEALVASEYSEHPNTSGTIGATLCLSLCPQFPARRLIEDRQLMDVIASETIPWRGVGFPSGTETITQQDSVLVLHPAAEFSVLEANVWGQLIYSYEIEHLVGEEGSQVAGIHLYAFLGHILVFLEHARTIYRKIGYDGSLLLRTLLKRVRGKPFIYSQNRPYPSIGPASRIDDEISFDVSNSARRLNEQRDEVAGDLLKTLFFSLNWAQQGADTSTMTDLLNKAAYYNSWNERS